MSLNPETAINISSLPKDDCFGCSVCVSTCPLDCIEMVFDGEGFQYPQVDEEVCNACRKCVKNCPGFNIIKKTENNSEPKFFGGYLKRDSIRSQSSSGGIFTAFAEMIQSQGGTVYGAVYDFERMAVVHKRATNVEAVSPMRTSKYVQSDTRGIYEQVKRDLNSGVPVLFTGTPCQVAGLNLFLGGPKQNLLTVDIVCHGVPSPGLFAAHFSTYEDRLEAPLTEINFRTKDKGWGSFLNFYLRIGTENGSVLRYAPLDAYYAMFLANLSLRPVCYQCKFASTERSADLTLGDFWGVQKQHPELFDGKGTSLILANSKKGMEALENIQQNLTILSLNELNPLPPNLVRPTPKPGFRKNFLKSIRFDRWRRQQSWKHLQALIVLAWNKVSQGFRRLFNLG